MILEKDTKMFDIIFERGHVQVIEYELKKKIRYTVESNIDGYLKVIKEKFLDKRRPFFEDEKEKIKKLMINTARAIHRKESNRKKRYEW